MSNSKKVLKENIKKALTRKRTAIDLLSIDVNVNVMNEIISYYVNQRKNFINMKNLILLLLLFTTSVTVSAQDSPYQLYEIKTEPDTVIYHNSIIGDYEVAEMWYLYKKAVLDIKKYKMQPNMNDIRRLEYLAYKYDAKKLAEFASKILIIEQFKTKDDEND